MGQAAARYGYRTRQDGRADIIRSLLEAIVLTPVDGKVEIDVRGDLAGILTLSAQMLNPAAGAAGSQT